MQNHELQQALQNYDEDSQVVLLVKYNGAYGLFTDIKVGEAKTKGITYVIFNSEELDGDYEAILDGKECVFND